MVYENIKKNGVEKAKLCIKNSTVQSCDLEAYRLNCCELQNCKLADSHISRSILDGGKIEKCDIINSTLEESGLWSLEMQDSKFQDVIFVFQNFTNITMKNNYFKIQSEGEFFVEDSVLECNDFSKCVLPMLTIRKSNLRSNNFCDCKIDEGEIEYTIFKSNNFANAEFTKSYFKRCTFEHMDFRNTKFENVEFIECKFEDCLYTEEQADMFGLI